MRNFVTGARDRIGQGQRYIPYYYVSYFKNAYNRIDQHPVHDSTAILAYLYEACARFRYRNRFYMNGVVFRFMIPVHSQLAEGHIYPSGSAYQRRPSRFCAQLARNSMCPRVR